MMFASQGGARKNLGYPKPWFSWCRSRHRHQKTVSCKFQVFADRRMGSDTKTQPKRAVGEAENPISKDSLPFLMDPGLMARLLLGSLVPRVPTSHGYHGIETRCVSRGGFHRSCEADHELVRQSELEVRPWEVKLLTGYCRGTL